MYCIGFWDVVVEVKCEGSFDSKICDYVGNDFVGLIVLLFELKVIVFNGGIVVCIGMKVLGEIGDYYIIFKFFFSSLVYVVVLYV